MKISDYYTHMTIMESLKDYASPDAKLTTMIQSGEVIRIRRGLYLSGNSASFSLKTLANMIYGPSYISFEYALSYYNLIPERVSLVTSASFRKNKSRNYNTPVGNFLYRSISEHAFAYEVQLLYDNEHPFLMATPEKALCDTLSKFSFSDQKELVDFLFQHMRIDEEELYTIDAQTVDFLAPLYSSKSVGQFAEYLKRT